MIRKLVIIGAAIGGVAVGSVEAVFLTAMDGGAADVSVPIIETVTTRSINPTVMPTPADEPPATVAPHLISIVTEPSSVPPPVSVPVIPTPPPISVPPASVPEPVVPPSIPPPPDPPVVPTPPVTVPPPPPTTTPTATVCQAAGTINGRVQTAPNRPPLVSVVVGGQVLCVPTK